jgi:hypothetical protein
MSSLPPQRQGGGGPGRGGAPGAKMTPEKGAQEAEKRLGKPCFHMGQKVQGVFACVACQFQIRNRAGLPMCPDCGEIIWAFMEDGPRPVPEGEATPIAPQADATPDVTVQEGVSLEPSAPEVIVEEGVRLDL